jgi:hypothetical protein
MHTWSPDWKHLVVIIVFIVIVIIIVVISIVCTTAKPKNDVLQLCWMRITSQCQRGSIPALLMG